MYFPYYISVFKLQMNLLAAPKEEGEEEEEEEEEEEGKEGEGKEEDML